MDVYKSEENKISTFEKCGRWTFILFNDNNSKASEQLTGLNDHYRLKKHLYILFTTVETFKMSRRKKLKIPA